MDYKWNKDLNVKLKLQNLEEINRKGLYELK